MIKMPSDWRDQAYSGGTDRLPAGGYICRITDTRMTVAKSGREGLILSFDIADGQYKDFYANHPTISWMASLWQSTPTGDSRTDGFFFGMLTAVEESNPGFQVMIDKNGNLVESCLEGKLVGVVFRDEEEEYNGRTFFRARPFRICSAQSIEDKSYKMPEPKVLPTADAPAKQGIPDGFDKIDDEDLPF